MENDVSDPEFSKLREKWENDNALARASILFSMEDDIIPLYEDLETAKEIMDALEVKHVPISNSHI